MHTEKRDHVHMKYIRKFMIIPGLWPLELKGVQAFLYNFYFYATYCFYILNVATAYVRAKEVIARRKPAEITDEIANTIFASILVIRAWNYRSKRIRELLKTILEIEKTIFENYDNDCVDIYKKNVKAAEYFAFIYLSQGLFALFMGQTVPLILTLASKPNATGYKEKYFIVPNWEPFDKYEYYYTTYFIHYCYTNLVVSYLLFCGTFFLFVLRNMTGQLKILQYRFSRIYENAMKMNENNNMSLGEACELLTKDCVRQHQGIIKMVANLDDIFIKYNFIDYVLTSFGLSMIILKFLYDDTIGMKCMSIAFFVLFACQPLLTHYEADVIAWNSSYGITQSIIGSSWYKMEVKTQKMLVFVVLRAQKPLTLSLGPFRKIGVDSVIALFKTTYSYLSVMWR